MSGRSVTPSRLRARTPSIVLTAGVLAIWVLFSWPLPRHVGDGIASSAHNHEVGAVRRMIPGDHLQLLYTYWLAGDMLSGRTPFFHDLYEFNAGNDGDRFRIHAQYAPFSWIHAAISAVGGRAAGMNLTGLLSLWLTAWFTMRLARRYTEDDAFAVLAGWISILFPYRWIMLLGGSPMGHAVAWVPLLFLGVDVVVRDLRPVGGLVAGLGLLCASLGDHHVFLFGTLASVGWAVLAVVARGGWPWRDARAWRVLLRAAGAALVGLVPALVMLLFTFGRIRGTAAATSRDLGEIALYSPRVGGLFRWGANGIDGHLYLGWTLCALAAVGLVGWIVRRVRTREDRLRLAVFLALLAAVAVVLVLAMGPHGPHGGIAWRAMRKLFPPYAAVRQPAKILCLIPTLAAVALAMGLTAWTVRLRRPAPRIALVAAVALAVVIEMKAQIRATVCTLDGEQGAYKAVAEHARAEGVAPRVLVLPLWPGDSAYSSVYQHYVSLYRIRMANGYSPAVKPAYLRDIYGGFRDFNHGDISGAALDNLLARGIGSIIFHEDLFPEKVSPSPAGRTLEALRRHPRLRFLARDGAAWAFTVLPAGAERADGPGVPEPYADVWPPARRAEIERMLPRERTVSDPACSRGAFAVLSSPGDGVALTRIPPHADPTAAWWLRVRGQGTLSTAWTDEADARVSGAELRVDAPGTWSWVRLAVPAGAAPFERAFLSLSWASGRVEADAAFFATAGTLDLAVGGTRVFPAAAFFRAGHTAGDGAVVLDPERDPADRIFYGPARPLSPGRYRVALEFHSSAAADAALGTLVVDGSDAPPVPVAAGRPAEAEFVQVADTPFVASFAYTRAAPVTIHRLVLLRLE